MYSAADQEIAERALKALHTTRTFDSAAAYLRVKPLTDDSGNKGAADDSVERVDAYVALSKLCETLWTDPKDPDLGRCWQSA